MKHFTIERRGHIQFWTFSNPPMNYMIAPAAAELIELIEAVEGDDETRVIVMTGGMAGKFITHYSVDELAATAADPALCARVMPSALEGWHRMVNRIMLMPKVVIAAINGDCMGGGLEIAMACDLRLAADGPYQLGLIESVLGILPGGGGTQRLTRLIGRGRALEAMLFGRTFTPREAEHIGMVNRTVEATMLTATAAQWAETLARRPPRALAAIKRAVYLGADETLATGLYIERQEMTGVMCSQDARTLMNAYNAVVARDPMKARSEFLNGIGVPAAEGK